MYNIYSVTLGYLGKLRSTEKATRRGDIGIIIFFWQKSAYVMTKDNYSIVHLESSNFSG